MTDTHLRRRSFLGLTAAGVGASALAPPPPPRRAPADDHDHDDHGHEPRPAVGYGPLVTDPDGLLDLPAGFSYTVLAVAGTAATRSPRRPSTTAAS